MDASRVVCDVATDTLRAMMLHSKVFLLVALQRFHETASRDAILETDALDHVPSRHEQGGQLCDNFEVPKCERPMCISSTYGARLSPARPAV